MTDGPDGAGSAEERRRDRAGRASSPLPLLLALVGVAVAALLIFGAAALLATSTDTGTRGQPVTVVIEKGADTATIADELAAKHVVGNALLFRLRARLDGADGRFKSGTYQLATGMDYAAVASALEEGPDAGSVLVTIPEGFTIHQIALRLQERAGVSAAEFERVATTRAGDFKAKHPFLRSNTTNTLEGYLFPKTYRVRGDAKPADVIDMMLDQFAKETAGLDLAGPKARGLDLHQVVTIASMIERETRLEKERPLVASVIYNRLRLDMRLEIDATVQYVLGNRPRLLYKDLKVDSPYNTYRYKGLPPGPIANPGLPSLLAAARPADTFYIYYVRTGSDGSHTFARNERDFEAAKKRARGGR